MRLVRSIAIALAAAGSFGFAGAALADETKCPLPLHECLEQYTHMRMRPWLGVWVDTDSTTGIRRIVKVLPGGAAEAAGVKPGDELRTIGGQAPKDWFAGKAGWKTGDRANLAVNRGGRDVTLDLRLEPISDEALAQVVGAHVLAGHIAYGDFGGTSEEPHRH